MPPSVAERLTFVQGDMSAFDLGRTFPLILVPFRAFQHLLELIDDAGRVVSTEETSWALRWTLRQEMIWLLELCGLQPVEQWSDFHRAAPAYGKEQIWVARAV